MEKVGYFCGDSEATLGCVFMKDSVESEKGFCRVTRCYATHFVRAKKGEYMRRVINASRGKKGFSSTVDSCGRRRETGGVIVLEVWFKLYNSRGLKPGCEEA